MKSICAFDFATLDYPRVGFDDKALEALELMVQYERNYAMIVEAGDIVGVIEQGEIVAAYGRGQLHTDTPVSALAQDRPCVDKAASFDDVVQFMAAFDLFQICLEDRVLDDFMLLRAIWTEQLAVAKEFREYEAPAAPIEEGSYGIGYG